MYHNKYGVPQNYKTEVKWYTLSAEQGIAEAQTNLGVMCYYGWVNMKDIVYAHMWVNISASNGDKNGKKMKELFPNAMSSSQFEDSQYLVIIHAKRVVMRK